MKAHLANLWVLIDADENSTVTGAGDFLTEFLGSADGVLDWAYSKKPDGTYTHPELVEVERPMSAEDYEEGDFLPLLEARRPLVLVVTDEDGNTDTLTFGEVDVETIDWLNCTEHGGGEEDARRFLKNLREDVIPRLRGRVTQDVLDEIQESHDRFREQFPNPEPVPPAPAPAGPKDELLDAAEGLIEAFPKGDWLAVLEEMREIVQRKKGEQLGNKKA